MARILALSLLVVGSLGLVIVGWSDHPELIVAGMAGLVLALFRSGLAMRLLSRDFQELADRAGALRHLAEELDTTVAALADERDQLRAILEGMRDGVVALDAEGRVALVNTSANALLGVHAMKGRTLLETVRVPALSEAAASALDGTAATTEVELRRSDGPRRLLATATPRIGGCVLVLHDVTEVRHLERVRQDFVANLSHELRTPIGVMSASAEALANGALDDPKQARFFVRSILRNAQRLATLVSDLLTLSRIESGDQLLEVQPIDLARAIEQALGSIQVRAEGHNQQVLLDVPGDLIALADPHALDQVLVNLLDNAVKYAGVGAHLTVRARATDAWLHIDVIDDGPGIPPQHRRRIFERFYRVDAGRSRELGGTGLGLSIVRHLVEAMGGSVEMIPNEPKGSIFRVNLPPASPSPPPPGSPQDLISR